MMVVPTRVAIPIVGLALLLAAAAPAPRAAPATQRAVQRGVLAKPAPVTTFDGSWARATPRSIARLDIDGASVHAFLACGDELCDIGTVDGTVYWTPGSRRSVAIMGRRGGRPAVPVALLATFRTSFRTLMVVASPPQGELVGKKMDVEIYADAPDVPQPFRETASFGVRVVPYSGDLPDAMPQLPLPLPRASVSGIVKPGLVTTGSGDTLGAAFDRLEGALQRAEIPQWAVYGIGDDGFAVVTQAERIGDDGSTQSERWPPPLAEVDPAGVASSLRDYLRLLFVGAGPGHYRVIVMAVTARLLTQEADPPDPARLDELLVTGARYLPDAMRQVVLGADGRCEVFIYEFERAAPEDPTHLRPNTGITMDRHLMGAGLWTAEELIR